MVVTRTRREPGPGRSESREIAIGSSIGTESQDLSSDPGRAPEGSLATRGPVDVEGGAVGVSDGLVRSVPAEAGLGDEGGQGEGRGGRGHGGQGELGAVPCLEARDLARGEVVPLLLAGVVEDAMHSPSLVVGDDVSRVGPVESEGEDLDLGADVAAVALEDGRGLGRVGSRSGRLFSRFVRGGRFGWLPAAALDPLLLLLAVGFRAPGSHRRLGEASGPSRDLGSTWVRPSHL